MYMFVTEWERERYSKVHNNEELDEEFQEARKYDNSLLIQEHTIFHKNFWKPMSCEITYQIYHETHPDESPYQARYQMTGSGKKEIVIAYLHGIINGALAGRRDK